MQTKSDVSNNDTQLRGHGLVQLTLPGVEVQFRIRQSREYLVDVYDVLLKGHGVDNCVIQECRTEAVQICRQGLLNVCLEHGVGIS